MTAILPRMTAGISHESQESFMNQRCRLQSLSRRLMSQPIRRQVAQFFIDQRQQRLRSGFVPVSNQFQNLRHVGHGEEYRVFADGCIVCSFTKTSYFKDLRGVRDLLRSAGRVPEGLSLAFQRLKTIIRH